MKHRAWFLIIQAVLMMLAGCDKGKHEREDAKAREMEAETEAAAASRQAAKLERAQAEEAHARALEAALAEARVARAKGAIRPKSLKDLDGKQWANSLGMKFAPVLPASVAFCVWETRVRDYAAFAAAARADASWKDPGFPQTPDQPVVKVNWFDAKAFCAWLTAKERGEGLIGNDMAYRLPTDEEWSVAVSLPAEPGQTPKEKGAKIGEVFPWGTQWPPPRGACNCGVDGVDEWHTSPAGSFAPNQFGLHDLGGNVSEWCEDAWGGRGSEGRALRGGSWRDVVRGNLLSSFRYGRNPSMYNRLSRLGFRCVLVQSGG